MRQQSALVATETITARLRQQDSGSDYCPLVIAAGTTSAALTLALGLQYKEDPEARIVPGLEHKDVHGKTSKLCSVVRGENLIPACI